MATEDAQTKRRVLTTLTAFQNFIIQFADDKDPDQQAVANAIKTQTIQ